MPDPTWNSYICCMMHLIKILKIKKHLQILFPSEKIEYIYSKVGGRYVGIFLCYLCFFACESMSLFFIVSFIQLLWADTMFQSPLSELERKKGKVNFFGQSLLLALTRALYAILLQFRPRPPFFHFCPVAALGQSLWITTIAFFSYHAIPITPIQYQVY